MDTIGYGCLVLDPLRLKGLNVRCSSKYIVFLFIGLNNVTEGENMNIVVFDM